MDIGKWFSNHPEKTDKRVKFMAENMLFPRKSNCKILISIKKLYLCTRKNRRTSSEMKTMR